MESVHLPVISLVLFLLLAHPTSTTAQTVSQAGHRVLTNADVLDMLKAGLTQDVVVAKIGSSNCDFDTSPETLKQLKSQSVPDAVILAMVRAPVAQPLRSAIITCISAHEVPLFSSPESSPPIAQVKCGENVSILEEGTWDRVRTRNGQVGYISSFFLPAQSSQGDAPASSVPSSTAAPSSSTIPSNMLRAVAWRAVPWVTTTYYQQPGTATTDCTGGGTWVGNIWHGNSDCTTRYTAAQSVPISWEHYTVYNLVETSDSFLVIACTRNWALSKCTYLNPGDSFSYDVKKGKISVKGRVGGKNKDQTSDFDVVSSELKTGR